MSGKRKLSGVLIAGVLWTLLLFTGVVTINLYATTPGPSGDPPPQWPGKSRITREEGSSTLLMFVHPRCACTLASLEELRRFLPRNTEPLHTVIVAAIPSKSGNGWNDTDLTRLAGRIPGAGLMLDLGLAETRRFGIRTSGELVLYDRDGRLRFVGGVTPARAHQGDSVGLSYLQKYNSRTREVGHAPTYGCDLEEPVHDFCGAGQLPQDEREATR